VLDILQFTGFRQFFQKVWLDENKASTPLVFVSLTRKRLPPPDSA